MEKLDRLVVKNNGYNCRARCRHTVKGDHGIHGDEYIYVIKAHDRLTALSLTIYTDVFPKSVGRPSKGVFEGSDISLHARFCCEFPPMENLNLIPIWIHWRGRECSWTEHCDTPITSSLIAHDFRRGLPQEDFLPLHAPTERFWGALMQKFYEYDQHSRRAFLWRDDYNWAIRKENFLLYRNKQHTWLYHGSQLINTFTCKKRQALDAVVAANEAEGTEVAIRLAKEWLT